MQRGKKFESFCDGGCFSVIQEGLCDFAGMTGLLGGRVGGGGGEITFITSPRRKESESKAESPRASKNQ